MRRAPVVLSTERTVVVGVDGTSPWRAAVAWAATEAVLRDAVLRVVHVTDARHHEHVGGGGQVDAPVAFPGHLPAGTGPGMLPAVVDAVDWVGATHPSLAVRGEALEGVPSATLVDAAATAELLVVGAHRPGGHAGHGAHPGHDVHRLGSVARHCVRHAPCPVVVVRQQAAENVPGTGASTPASRVVVGVDGSAIADAAFRWALDEAGRRDLPVVAVHAWQPPPVGETMVPPSDASERVAAAVAAAARELAAAAGWSSRVDVVTTVGATVPALVEASRDADLLVVGARGHGRFRDGLVGSVAWRCAEEAACPVAVVRGEAAGHPAGTGAGGARPTVATVRYPSELEGDVTLADGAAVHVRPIRPGDAPALVDFHRGLSDRTVYRRFFFDHPVLAADEVERFTSVDYVDRLAFVAEDAGRLVAVARYDVTPHRGEAELAFVVADDHQHRGIGTALCRRLVAAAAERGIPRFVAYTQPGNHEMLGVLTGAGVATTTELVDGVLAVRGPTAPCATTAQAPGAASQTQPATSGGSSPCSRP